MKEALIYLLVSVVIGAGLFLAISNAPQYGSIGILPPVPGVVNPNVTQANINQTICVSGWTATVRPPTSYTGPIKAKLLPRGENSADFELDHYIAIELGGSPTDKNNLWDQSYKTTPGAHEKDHVENYLKAQVCSGGMTLLQAQYAITHDWTKVLAKIGKFGGIPVNDQDDETL